MRATALVFAIALPAFGFWMAPAGRAAAQSAPLLRAEFRIELEPASTKGGPQPADPGDAGERLLGEAAWAYGGMLWGFEFEYAPYDRARGIAETFRLRSLGAIERGDPRLVPGPASSDGRALRAYVEYRPDEAGAGLVESYRREPWKAAQGLGKAEVALGWAGRRAACEDALREAVRAHLRSIEPNKPRGASGRVVLERPPTIRVQGGRYTAQLRARIEVLEWKPYVVY